MNATDTYPTAETVRTASDNTEFRAGYMYCTHCHDEICLVDDDADLAGLVNLAATHLTYCDDYKATATA